jgi:hypothetical protein
MRKIALAASGILLVLIIHSCSKKTDTPSANARTVQNFTGSYNLTALLASALGQTVNLYDSLPPCEKDNVIKLSANMTAQFIDSGVMCVPSSDSSGTWSLSQNTDTLYVSGTPSFIQSWDGKTLVLINNETISGFPAVATTTLVKQ